jgi:hypothetical protein
VIVHDDVFGDLTFDRSLDWYEVEATWLGFCGHPISVSGNLTDGPIRAGISG